jgi:peptide/nickel transport system substrate-binding protein
VNKLISFLGKRFDLPKADLLHRSIRSFSLTEKSIFWVFVFLFAVSGIILAARVNAEFLVIIPDHGGQLKEGVLGSPRFVNPLLATSDADRDMVSLVYSGLLKASPEGTLTPDLAESYRISEDGLVYEFTLRESARFHDGEPVTADDVVFTVLKAQDPAIRSPRRGSWEGVTVERVDVRTVRFSRAEPYAPFIENTTLGILPEHAWQSVNPEDFTFSRLNTEPIGSGPYRVQSFKRDSAGLPVSYKLKSFSQYVLGKPFISTISVSFYQNEENLVKAYEDGDIESVRGLSAHIAHTLETEGVRIEQSPLPRIFGVFFNQNQASVLASLSVREALDVVLDKEAIVSSVLFGYGSAIDGPIPPRVTAPSEDVRTAEERIAEASEILIDAGWEKNDEGVWVRESDSDTTTLSFSLATGDTPELKATAEAIQEEWQSFGVEVDLEIFETGNLNQNVIRPRRYDALFFGEIIGRDLDFYPFWHSSQRNDPGLNIALYVNSTVDDLVERSRQTSDESARSEMHEEFAEEIYADRPAAFIYAPNFLYALPEKVKGITLGQLTTPAERFANIHEWHIETDTIWKIFNH